MRVIGGVIAAAMLAGMLASCADPYYPRYGYSQGYYYPQSYGYAAPPAYSYSTPQYAYQSRGDYYRNYNGIHPGPEYYP
jgi:hypothetical protein